MKNLSDHILESFKENKEDVQQTIVESQENEETVAEDASAENEKPSE